MWSHYRDGSASYSESLFVIPASPKRRSCMIEGIRIMFIAGFGPIVRDAEASVKLYSDIFGIDFEEPSEGYLHTEKLEGSKAFALWPISQAAESCFGTSKWPEDIMEPQAWLEFEVEDVSEATNVLKNRGYKFLVSNRKEPWGQTVTRFLSPEGILLGLTETPWMRKEKRE